MSKPKPASSRLSAWQQLAINDLYKIAAEHPDAVEILTTTPTLTDTHAQVKIRLPTEELPFGPGGLRRP